MGDNIEDWGIEARTGELININRVIYNPANGTVEYVDKNGAVCSYSSRDLVQTSGGTWVETKTMTRAEILNIIKEHVSELYNADTALDAAIISATAILKSLGYAIKG